MVILYLIPAESTLLWNVNSDKLLLIDCQIIDKKRSRPEKNTKKIVHESKSWLDGVFNVDEVIAERIFVKYSV